MPQLSPGSLPSRPLRDPDPPCRFSDPLPGLQARRRLAFAVVALVGGLVTARFGIETKGKVLEEPATGICTTQKSGQVIREEKRDVGAVESPPPSRRRRRRLVV